MACCHKMDAMSRKIGLSESLPPMSSVFAPEPPTGMEVTEGSGSDEEWALWNAVVNGLTSDASGTDPLANGRLPPATRD